MQFIDFELKTAPLRGGNWRQDFREKLPNFHDILLFVLFVENLRKWMDLWQTWNENLVLNRSLPKSVLLYWCLASSAICQFINYLMKQFTLFIAIISATGWLRLFIFRSGKYYTLDHKNFFFFFRIIFIESIMQCFIAGLYLIYFKKWNKMEKKKNHLPKMGELS